MTRKKLTLLLVVATLLLAVTSATFALYVAHFTDVIGMKSELRIMTPKPDNVARSMERAGQHMVVPAELG